MQTALGALHLNTSKSTRASYNPLHASDELLCDASHILPRRQPAPWLLLDDLCANFFACSSLDGVLLAGLPQNCGHQHQSVPSYHQKCRLYKVRAEDKLSECNVHVKCVTSP